jgi:hypothetical protein
MAIMSAAPADVQAAVRGTTTNRIPVIHHTTRARFSNRHCLTCHVDETASRWTRARTLDVANTGPRVTRWTYGYDRRSSGIRVTGRTRTTFNRSRSNAI